MIKRGVCQGCVLSPCLFNLYKEVIFIHIEDMENVIVGGVNINNLRYADDTVLLTDSEGSLQTILNNNINNNNNNNNNNINNNNNNNSFTQAFNSLTVNVLGALDSPLKTVNYSSKRWVLRSALKRSTVSAVRIFFGS